MTAPAPRPSAFRLAEFDPVIRRAVTGWLRNRGSQKSEQKEEGKTNG